MRIAVKKTRKCEQKVKDLGLGQPITRRDLLHGMSLSAAALATYGVGFPTQSIADDSSQVVYAPEKDPDYYPPARHGLRGDHPGSFEVAHAQRDGKSWNDVRELDEEYDLIVVGGGISGLAAAFSYMQKSSQPSRILVLDNHDDFGGQAKRVEFSHGGKTYMTPGGSGFMETPYFSEQSKQLLADCGVSLKRLEPGQVEDLRLHAFDMSPSICFDKETYGKAVTLVADLLPMNRKDESGGYVLSQHVGDMPLTDAQKAELLDFLSAEDDVFEVLSNEEREAALYSMSYNTFVTEYCGLSQETADAIFTRQPGALSGVTADCTPLYETLTLAGLPGTNRLGRQGEAIQAQLESMPGLEGHYAPEGNAIIARNLVKRLIPEITPAESMEELTTAHFNYAKLDDSASYNRIRLNSTVINIRTTDPGTGVAVTYVRGGKAYRAKSKHCIYAGFHMHLPYLCPELPKIQKAALAENVKMPFVAAQVFLRNGKPIQELGTASFYFPGRYLHECAAWGRSLGKHKQDFDPEEPVIIYMIGPMVEPHTGLTPSDQHRQGRYRLLSMTFEDYELEVREQMASLFASTSFDVTRDIIGLTVNRWPHGYTRQFNPMFDPEYEDGMRPNEIARRQFGPISIANSDASYIALCNTAIDEGLRAVDELLG